MFSVITLHKCLGQLLIKSISRPCSTTIFKPSRTPKGKAITHDLSNINDAIGIDICLPHVSWAHLSRAPLKILDVGTQCFQVDKISKDFKVDVIYDLAQEILADLPPTSMYIIGLKRNRFNTKEMAQVTAVTNGLNVALFTSIRLVKNSKALMLGTLNSAQKYGLVNQNEITTNKEFMRRTFTMIEQTDATKTNYYKENEFSRDSIGNALLLPLALFNVNI